MGGDTVLYMNGLKKEQDRSYMLSDMFIPRKYFSKLN